MPASPCCPFCGSHLLTVTNRTARLTFRSCSRCYKHWAEANVGFAAAYEYDEPDAARKPSDVPRP